MRIEAYLLVVSDEATIRTIHEETHVQGATIKQLKAQNDPPARDVLWRWATARVSLDVDNPDDGVKALLSMHRPIFPAIRKHYGPKSDIYLQMVTRYREDEDPCGLYLSAETISLLGELGGALDNDAVWIVDDLVAGSAGSRAT